MLPLTVTPTVTKAERFKRMRELEKSVERLVEKGWRVQRIMYDDEANESLCATFTLTIDGTDERGVL